jgi:methyl-accepting chemotaxis protein
MQPAFLDNQRNAAAMPASECPPMVLAIRARTSQGVTAFLALISACSITLTCITGEGRLAGITTSALLLSVTVLVVLRDSTALMTRIVLATTLAIGLMLLIYATTPLGPGAIQEAHMLYFVTNTFLLLSMCWRTQLLYNILVVLHHVVLTLVAPIFIWSSTSSTTAWADLAVHAGIALVLVPFAIFISNYLLRSLMESARQMQDINAMMGQISDQHATLEHRVAELNASGERARVIGEENSRIRNALDRIAAGAIIVDLNDQITYANDFARLIFRSHEAEFRRVVPGFDAEIIVGRPFTTFAGVPGLAGIAAEALETGPIDVALGDARLRITPNAVVDSGGKRLGTVLQWIDRTEEVLAEEEVNRMVATAIDGDFSVRIREEGKNGFLKTLAAGANRLVAIMEEVIRTLSSTATQVAIGASEISVGNSDLSHRTEEQAASLEETASSMEQMTSAVQLNAGKAAEASQLVRAARDQAERSGVVVRSAVTAMREIDASSKMIADIIDVIDSIAFQTNLLALNAAVEAARAGEQGRGFAVVAGEVRNLASRSAGAAKQIKKLVEGSVAKVNTGSDLVDASGKALEDIVAVVKKVADVVSEIAASSHQQAAGIEQVNKAVTSMDEVTQQNAALVEEATAAAQSLNQQAANLTQLMGRFKVGVQSERAVARARVAAAPICRAMARA